MRAAPPFCGKRSAKKQREYRVLLGCVEHYLRTGKPVGSNTLKHEEFQGLSSATIRNYFSELEKEGYLIQQHASGGRIPTSKAYRAYAAEYAGAKANNSGLETEFRAFQALESPGIVTLLEKGAEELSRLIKMAVFISAPRFDHDYLIDIKLVAIDPCRCLCVLITNFGLIHTETLHADIRLTTFSVKRIESYFRWKLTGIDKPENIEETEEALAQQFYNEVVVRYIVGYAHFIDEEIYRTGFSRLLEYPEFDNAKGVAQGLALFENRRGMRYILTETSKAKAHRWWIDDDLALVAPGSAHCSVIAHPYGVGQTSVGAVGVLGPMRMPYRELFGLLNLFTERLNEALVKIVYKHQITYRQPQEGALLLQKQEQKMIGQTHPSLLTHKK